MKPTAFPLSPGLSPARGEGACFTLKTSIHTTEGTENRYEPANLAFTSRVMHMILAMSCFPSVFSEFSVFSAVN